MSEDLRSFRENLESEKDALDKIFEDYRHKTLNNSDFQKILQSSTRILVEKNEVVRREKRMLENRLITDSADIFNCLTDVFITYSKTYDAAYQASLHNTTEKTHLCYRKIRESQLLLIQAAYFLEGYRDYHKVNERFIKLKKKIGSERLSELLTIQTTEFLFRQVNEFWNNSSYREGRFVLQICHRRLSDLLQQNPEAIRDEDLEKRVEKNLRLGERAEMFISDKNTGDFKELTVIENLTKTGFHNLAERLMSDLEYIFASCQVFFQEYDAYRNSVQEEKFFPVISDDELQTIILESGWEAAVRKLSKTTFKVQMEILRRLNFETLAINQKLDEKLKPAMAGTTARPYTK